MNLFKVELSSTIYVLADDIDDAETKALDNLTSTDEEPWFAKAEPATEPLPEHWVSDIPYGNINYRTCSEILKDGAGEPEES